nr:S41 family peptidase [uncultured Massilia sp.]
MRHFPVLLAALLSAAGAHAAPASTTRATLIERVAAELDTAYIDADRAAKLGPALRGAGFDGNLDDEAFAKALTALMQDVTRDPHLRLIYNATPAPAQAGPPPPEEIARRQAYLRERNYGIERVERLPGNIGYLKTQFFAPAADAAPAIGAAMTLLGNTSALILDLRDNDGGAADAVPLMASYLFDERTHLSDLYRREGNITEQQWTSPGVPGVRYGQEKDVYILTSKDTFSAAEGLAFALKNRKRAVIVGESTRGGAHPSRIKRIDAHFALMVPASTARDPVTGLDWEGTGVQPDLAVPAPEALTRTQILILDKLLPSAQGHASQEEIRTRLAKLRAEAPASSR